MELIAKQLNYPTSIEFDDQGQVYVAESGLPFGGAAPGGRIWRIDKNGGLSCLKDNLRHPVTGMRFYKDHFYLTEGGYPGRISRLSMVGEWQVILDNLPGKGNYHTNMAVVGPDGKLYFSQGALTNSGVIGLDAYDLQWLKQLPHPCDIPGIDIRLSGQNFKTPNPFGDHSNGQLSTGAFSPFGQASEPGQLVKGQLPCTAAMLRCNLDGSNLELVAWGLRNAFGIGFLPDGRLLAIDQGADDRGSRPIGNVPDFLYEVKAGSWYGWPDYYGGRAITEEAFHPTRGAKPSMILMNQEQLPPPEKALLEFPVNAAATKFDIAPESWAPYDGQLFVALFGDEKPLTARPGEKVGRSIARINPNDWSLHAINMGPFQRPIDVRFHPQTQDLYVLDFGFFEMKEKGMDTKSASGALYCIKRNELDI